MKTYDYINRVVITLPLTVYEGTWTNTLPSRCYAITMILRVRRNFFEITMFPNRIIGMLWFFEIIFICNFTWSYIFIRHMICVNLGASFDFSFHFSSMHHAGMR